MTDHPEASLSAADLAARLAAGWRPVLVDVREAHELAAGMLAGARHIPLATVAARAGELPRTGPVVVYCQRGVRSAHAIATLSGLGFTNLINLADGYSAWAASGAAGAPPQQRP